MDVTLDNIARAYLGKNGYNTLHHYVRVMRFLVDFLRKVSVNHKFFDKTVVLRLDAKKAIQWPSDCVIWNVIAWQSGDRLIGFQRDSTINLHHDECDDGPTETPNSPFDINTPWPYVSSQTINLNNYNLGGVNGCLQAYGVGWNGLGYWKPNFADREIQFSSEVPADFEIYFSYKTNGFLPKTKSVIPELFSKLGEDYVHWQMARFKFGDAAVETEARKLAYQSEYNEVLSPLNKLSYEDISGSKARAFHVNKLTG